MTSGDTSVEIVEVGPRDGLQNESEVPATAFKLAFIRRLAAAGVRRIEVASFVHPELVPQMADAEALVGQLTDLRDVTLVGLVLNRKGYERALATRQAGRGIDEVGCVAVTSDTFAQKNQGQTSAQSIAVSKEILRAAAADGLPAQVTISAAFGCPFEGEIPASRVVEIARELAEEGPREFALADTIGVGVPGQVRELFERVQDAVPGIPLRGHFHNTRNTGIANAWAAVEAGATTLDSSVGGLGGCPFAPKATGNIATEDLVYLMERSGVRTGLDLDDLISTVAWLQDRLGRELPAMVSRAGGFPPVLDAETETKVVQMGGRA